ncbi:MAG: hypothetical protein Q7U89_02630 [Coriobacteriia bacterium]|nr:hypothetical protein [Coriobacteriia bacterium]
MVAECFGRWDDDIMTYSTQDPEFDADVSGDPIESPGGFDSTEPTIIDALGIELSVTNPAVAEALLAQSSIQFEHSSNLGPDELRELRAEAAQAVPDVLLATHTVRDEDESRRRAELRKETMERGASLGFDISPEGIWTSSSGVTMIVRSVGDISSAAGAADLLLKLNDVVDRGVGAREALIITDDQASADLVSSAIVTRDGRCRFRVSAYQTLADIAALHVAGRISRASAQAFLIPSAQIDAAILLAAIQPFLGPD